MREPYRWGDPKPPAAARVAGRRRARQNAKRFMVERVTTWPGVARTQPGPAFETKAEDPLSWNTP